MTVSDFTAFLWWLLSEHGDCKSNSVVINFILGLFFFYRELEVTASCQQKHCKSQLWNHGMPQMDANGCVPVAKYSKCGHVTNKGTAVGSSNPDHK